MIGPLKIRLLQCYVVLWIHSIDAICIFKVVSYFSADYSPGQDYKSKAKHKPTVLIGYIIS